MNDQLKEREPLCSKRKKTVPDQRKEERTMRMDKKEEKNELECG
jgi:hypothetical protein